MMAAVRTCLMRWLVLGFVLAPLSGCLLAADVVNPAAWAAIGIDPATVARPPGVILVAFNNTTRYDATFFAYSMADRLDPTKGARSFAAVAEAGQTANEVLECPVGVISAGTLQADFSVDTLAATVETGEEQGQVQVAYAGPALELGTAFACGDVIEIRLIEQRVGETSQYFISLRVIPGR